MEEESSSLSEVIERFLPHTPSLVINFSMVVQPNVKQFQVF